MKTKIIRLLCLINILCIPLSDYANWNDQGRYIIKTGLIALSAMITYEKLKTWWSPSTPLDCDKLIELTSKNAECANRLEDIFRNHFSKEIESTKAIQESYAQEMKGLIKTLESYKTSSEQCCKELSSYKTSAEQCCQEFQKHIAASQKTHDQLQEYIQQFEPLKAQKQEMQANIKELIQDTAELRQITGIGIIDNAKQYSLTYVHIGLDANVKNLSKKVKVLEETVQQLQDAALNTQ